MSTKYVLSGVAGVAAVAAILAGCAVGPDFHRPPLPAVGSYTSEHLTATVSAAHVHGGEEQKFVTGRDLPHEWWKLFKSPHLNSLIEQSIKQNPSIDAAKAALRQARENVAAQKGYYYPTAQVGASVTRAHDSGTVSPVPASGAEPYTLHTAQVSLAYTLDIFGRNSRQVESLEAQANFQRFQLEAAYITLTSNVVASAIQEASLRAQIEATKEIIRSEGEMLKQLHQQFDAGYVAGLDVAAQEAAFAQAEQALPPLEKQLEQTRDLLAALAGRFPDARPEERFELKTFTLPQELPVSLPARLVAQRPDVRAAEEQLHSASAQVGVAFANMLPDITLSADLGSTAATIGRLFSGGTGFWGLTGNVAQTVFDGGTLLHTKRAAEAGLDMAAAQYRSTVISAFQNVADSLHALKSDAEALNSAASLERASHKSLDLARKQFEAGYVNYLALLSSEQAYQQAVVNLVQAEANRYADTAA